MTLVSLPSPIAFPGLLISPSNTPNIGTVATLDASGEYVAYIFSAREDMTISHVGFLVGAVTNSPTMEIRIETVDASGLPSGTLWATNTNIVTAALSSGWTLQALTASASVTKGQMVCVKLLWGGAATSTLIVQHLLNTTSGFGGNLPYSVINTGTPTKTGISNLPALALGSSLTTFYNVPGFVAFNAHTANAFNNTSSAKRGLRFVPNFNCRAVGIRWFKGNATGDCNISLMDDAGTELSGSSTALDNDHTLVTQTGSVAVYFDNPVVLAAGTAYRVALQPTSATNINITTLTLPSSDYFSATPAKSAAVATYATFATATWTDSTTQIPLMDVLLDQIDNGEGSGGVIGVVGG